MRAITSVLPPAANGTMTVTVLLSHSCACAPAGQQRDQGCTKCSAETRPSNHDFQHARLLFLLMHSAGEMTNDLGARHQVRIFLSHIEQVCLMRRDGAIADAIGHHDGTKIVAHGIDHRGPHAARRGAARDQDRVDALAGEPAAQVGPEEGRRLGLRMMYSPFNGSSSGTTWLAGTCSVSAASPGALRQKTPASEPSSA